MSFTKSHPPSPEQVERLLSLAAKSIEQGIGGRRLQLDLSTYTGDLVENGASFVTLKINGVLRGCVGTLDAHQPLVVDVAENAYAAAFRDTRFQPLTSQESLQLDIHISLLTPSEPMQFDSEQDLLNQLRPYEDGLIFSSGHYRATFLPTVWESLPEPQEFLRQLKHKAGLAPEYWSDDIKVRRYSALSILAHDKH